MRMGLRNHKRSDLWSFGGKNQCVVQYSGLSLIFEVGGNVPVAREFSYYSKGNKLFFYQSSWGSNSEFAGKIPGSIALNDSPGYCMPKAS